MQANNKTRKLILTSTVASALAFAVLHTAYAGPGQMRGPGPQAPCQEQGQQFDEETLKARDAFLAETVELRKKMAQTRAAKKALMKTDTPDQAQAAKLAGELFDLREQLRVKARAAGLPANMMRMRMGRMGDDGEKDCGCQQGRGDRASGGYRM